MLLFLIFAKPFSGGCREYIMLFQLSEFQILAPKFFETTCSLPSAAVFRLHAASLFGSFARPERFGR